jgi:phosphate starvation-inducible PhoH-like protein
VQLRLPEVEAQTDNQGLLITSIKSKPQTIVFGPAGTGKTYVPMAMAASMLDAKSIKKIVLTRPNVSAGPSLGAFPGTKDEKMAEWVVPLVEVLRSYLGGTTVDYLVKQGAIEVVPFETMRGRSIDNAFIMLDEAQNTTPHEIKMFLTRVGKNCKVVVNGDVSQSDLGRGRASGLAKALQLVARAGPLNSKIGVVEFGIDDVVRSDITGDWVRAFWEDEQD